MIKLNPVPFAVAAALFLVSSVDASAQKTGQRVHNKKVTAFVDSGQQPANGGTCTGPTAFTASPYTDSGTTVGGTDFISVVPEECSQWGTVDGPEVIYSFVAGPGANLTFNIAPQSPTYDPAAYVVSTCTNASSCVVGADAAYEGDAETFTASSLTSGTTYYLHVDSYYPASYTYGSGPFILSVTGTLPVQLQEFEVN